MRSLGLIAALALGMVLSGGALAGHIDTDEFQKGCGFSEDDWEEGRYDCNGGIPSIQNPSFQNASEADTWLEDDERVIGIETEDGAKAYPIPILNWHEIANDEVDETPLTVTYCPLCDSALVFEREVDGQTLDFHVSGYLYRQDLVMVDEQTHSLWPQIEAQAARGPHHGTDLRISPSTTTTWGDWRAANPDTLVLERPRCGGNATDDARSCRGEFQRDYEEYPYGSYRYDRSVGVSGGERHDIEGLHPKARVVGVTIDGQPKAYPFPEIEEGQTLLEDEHADRPLAIAITGTDAHVFQRPEGLNLTREDEGPLQADDGRAWDPVTGQAEGDHANLERLETVDLFWFAWLDHNPRTAVYTANGTEHVEAHTPPKQTPGPGALAGLAALAVGAAAAATLLGRRETR